MIEHIAVVALGVTTIWNFWHLIVLQKKIDEAAGYVAMLRANIKTSFTYETAKRKKDLLDTAVLQAERAQEILTGWKSYRR